MILLVYLVPICLLLVATVCDLRTRIIPDWISIAIGVSALIATTFGLHYTTWLNLSLGALLGFTVGFVSFWLGGLGGGDVKLITALGAFVGPVPLIFVLFWMALAGGVLAIIARLRKQDSFAYVPAIAAGFAAYLIYPGCLWQVFFQVQENGVPQ